MHVTIQLHKLYITSKIKLV